MTVRPPAVEDRASPGSASALRVVVVDDHPIYRAAMAATVRGCPDLQLVGEFADGRVALDAILALSPDVALLDVRLPGLDGFEVLEALVRQRCRTRVLFLSAQLDERDVYESLAAGAAGFLSKLADELEVSDAILAVAAGGTVIPGELTAGVPREIGDGPGADREDLRPRQREILQMVSEGKTAQQIAERLHLATPTVKAHLQQLYKKLEVSDRAAAVAVALRRGLIE